METKFSRGPWKQSLPDDTAVIAADGWPVCETGVGQDYDEHFERMEADARLIAAAPELFEALDSALLWMLVADGPLKAQKIQAVLAQGRAALAKATGEQA